MRLCIKNFLHGDALHVVVDAVEQTAGPDIITALRQRVKGRVTGPELFHGLDASAIAAKLKLRGNSVTLIASEAELFGTAERPARSSVLNRLIVWVLVSVGKVNVVASRIPDKGITGSRGAYEVKLKSGDTVASQDVLLRHGPEAPFGKYDEPKAPKWMDSRLTRPIKRLADKWKALYDSDEPDATVDRDHWDDRLLVADRLSPDAREHIGLLVYSQTKVGKDSNSLRNTISSAVLSEQVQSALGSAPAAAKLALMPLDDALNGPRAFGRTIRALCYAPIVVFDGTA